MQRRGRSSRYGPTPAPAGRVNRVRTQREATRASSSPVWFFDLDNTLHDAGAFIFPTMNAAMRDFMVQALTLPAHEADRLREHYWLRYGSTLQGLMRHHTVDPHHFLQVTHAIPQLEHRVRAHAHDVAALKRLRGRKILLTNAQGDYARTVLKALGLSHCFDGLWSIEDLQMFGQWRPKPDRRMFRHLAVRLRCAPQRCWLIEDTLEHQKAARSVGWKTVWMQRWLFDNLRQRGTLRPHLRRKPAYTHHRVRQLSALVRCDRIRAPL